VNNSPFTRTDFVYLAVLQFLRQMKMPHVAPTGSRLYRRLVIGGAPRLTTPCHVCGIPRISRAWGPIVPLAKPKAWLPPTRPKVRYHPVKPSQTKRIQNAIMSPPPRISNPSSTADASRPFQQGLGGALPLLLSRLAHALMVVTSSVTKPSSVGITLVREMICAPNAFLTSNRK
jgi:hypothetical protein